MRLKNKKTGEIVEPRKIGFELFSFNEWIYKSLAELNEEWQDYEEPSKTIWQIKDSGELQDFEEDDFSDGYMESSKSIGNYFETEEEAEKALEKLKAWTRLKDNGVEFNGWVRDKDYCGDYIIRVKMTDETTCDDEDLDLLFGGEE